MRSERINGKENGLESCGTICWRNLCWNQDGEMSFLAVGYGFQQFPGTACLEELQRYMFSVRDRRQIDFELGLHELDYDAPQNQTLPYGLNI